MKIPNSVKIGAHQYNIILSDSILPDDDRWGSFCSRKAEMVIADNLHVGKQWETLFHEVLEAINATNELELRHNQITSIACNFYEFLIDNNLLKEGD